MGIKYTYELPVSEENKWIYAKVAAKIGWYPEMEKTPEQFIEEYFVENSVNFRGVVENTMRDYFGEAQADTAKAIMGLYDSQLKVTIKVD